MKFSIEKGFNKSSLAQIKLLLIPVWAKGGKVEGYGEVFGKLDKSDKKLIIDFLIQKPLRGGETKFMRLNRAPDMAFVAVEQAFTEKKLALLIRQFIRIAKAENIKRVGVCLDDFIKDNISAERTAELITDNALLAHFDFSEEFKSRPKDGWKFVERVTMFTSGNRKATAECVRQAEIITDATNRSRVLSNYPPADITPEGVVEAARQVATEIPTITLTIFDEKKLAAEGMNAILAVGKGSGNPPRLIVMEYQGGNPKDKPIALVGKGVTFDSGGLNIKPAEGMLDMHLDMSGGSAVIYAVYAIAKLKLPVNVIGLVPAVENMPSGLSYHQNDIIRAYGGKTIEIGHTDAEGRVILADAIEYAKTKKPAVIVTIATLTGAAMGALGTRMSALFVKNNKPLSDEMEAIGEKTADLVWPLPLMDEADRDVEGAFADVTNTSRTGSRYGGAITAASFLWQFARPAHFVHLDMAPRMISNPEEDQLSKGSVGFGVRLFVEIAKQWDNLKKLL